MYQRWALFINTFRRQIQKGKRIFFYGICEAYTHLLYAVIDPYDVFFPAVRFRPLCQQPLSPWQLQHERWWLPLHLQWRLWRNKLWAFISQPSGLWANGTIATKPKQASLIHTGARHRSSALKSNGDVTNVAAESRTESCRSEMGWNRGESILFK